MRNKNFCNAVTVVLAHPAKRSFCSSIASTLAQVSQTCGVPTVHMQDLYLDSFQPVLEEPELRRRMATDVISVRYTRELQQTNLLLLIYPLWWNMPPAIMKGWLDRILMPGFAFDFHSGHSGFATQGNTRQQPLLQNTDMMVIYTSDMQALHSTSKEIWESIARYIGIDNLSLYSFEKLRERSYRERITFIDELSAALRRKIEVSRPAY